ncbi:transmembrane inner ear expressed protein-like [Montipora foliosa]|uniref:transmembrane inner ear expressed protein-like n=1 Tax=Montipora foliosa TaxID=591990 RepID=UPI0035F1BFE9
MKEVALGESKNLLNFIATMAKAGAVQPNLIFKTVFFHSLLFGFQVEPCFAQNNDLFIPPAKVKTLAPKPTTSTPIPVTEKNLWGLRMWQVVGLAFVATVLSVVFCCCLCDCRVPKTGYDKDGQAKQADGDGSDTEPAVVHSRPLQDGKRLESASNQQRKVQDTGNSGGKVNQALESERETAAQDKGWKTIQRTMLSRQP